jgi:hypothetical protein
VSGDYERLLDAQRGVRLAIRFTTVRREVVDYAVVLFIERDERRHTIRVYDSAHGFNEMHRHSTAGGKQAGAVFHRGSLGEGMRAAIVECVDRYETIIEAWQR